MPRTRQFFIFFALAVLACPRLRGDYAVSVKNAIQAIQPFRAHFVQQVFIDDSKELEEEGELSFLNENCFKWAYLRPEPKVFLCTGEQYQFYQPAENQVTRGIIQNKQEQVLWKFLLAGKIPADARCDEKTRRITLQQRIKDDVSWFEITMGPDFLPNRVVQTDASGYKTVYLFSQFRKKVQFSSTEFALAIPAGTDIIAADE